MITALVTANSPHWHGGGGWPLFPGLLFALLVLGLAMAAFWWFGRRTGAGPGSASGQNAEDILAERYAKGEMSDDEFLQRQSMLRDREGRAKK